ncbi:MAG: hypothetical protein JWO67_3742, partial [Streptosporangiaceae bacterium]|nr:hypothetical protein [Streptosporangiaceae bacterium]
GGRAGKQVRGDLELGLHRSGRSHRGAKELLGRQRAVGRPAATGITS